MLRIIQPVLLTGFLFYSVSLFAQDDETIYVEACRFMDAEEFETAVEGFGYIPGYKDTNYKSVICQLLSHKYRNTPIEKFKKFEGGPEADKLFNYWLGKIQLKRFNLQEAEKSFNQFLNDVKPSDSCKVFEVDANVKLTLIRGASNKMVISTLESPINSRFADLPGTFLNGGDRLIFMSDRNAHNSFEVYQTEKGAYGWNAPEIISPTKIPSEFVNVLNVRESLVFLDPENKHLQKVDVTGGSWNVHEDLDLYFLKEAHHIYVNKYGTRVIYSKEVEGGNLDLYESYKLRSTGEWMEPTPIPGLVNSSFNEDYPFLTDDRTRLYFSSNRPGGLGKTDIYYVEMDPNTNHWGKPVNAGLPVNSVDNDISFTMSSDNKTGLISSDRIYSAGDLDLFVLEVKD